MSRLEELIQRYCPNGVEFKRLEECCKIFDSQRKPITKSSREPGPYPYYGANGIQDYVANYIFDGTYILIGEDGSVITENGTPIVNWVEGKIWVNNHAHIISETDNVLLRYLYHYIQTVNIRDLVHGNIPKLTGGDLKDIKIAVPPLEVQREIVEILDKFSFLSAELSAELKVRKEQYEVYRKMLLENCDAEFVQLKTVLKKSCSGATPKKGVAEFYENGNVPWIRTQDVKFNNITEVDSYITNVAVEKTGVKWIPKNCVIVAISGATAGRCAINKIEATTNQHCLNLEIDSSKALYKYIYYCICDNYEELLSRKQGARGDLNSTLVLDIKIPLPSLDNQKKMVDLLDKFYTLCNDISSGLPAEIEARQKQYEYYRDKLLTFKKKEI